jgi:hypothetical protein
MKIAKHVKGGTVSFRLDGRSVTIGPGYIGPVPDRILDKYRQQGRFEIMEDPFLNRVTADVKRGEALLRSGDGTSEPSPGQKPAGAVPPPPPVKLPLIARHRGRGLWCVTEVATGKPVSEMMTRDEAEKKAAEMNGVS